MWIESRKVEARVPPSTLHAPAALEDAVDVGAVGDERTRHAGALPALLVLLPGTSPASALEGRSRRGPIHELIYGLSAVDEFMHGSLAAHRPGKEHREPKNEQCDD
mmetsp:Transcript_19862/g.45794  ORF Transcript_19862/g.45794 Transcript_19862/m.45794 type:complete len:106 (-) Transcript_19862:318-635(-)|eukprot:CAMPEP_0119381540 /NCGR_PEP_ID=MMETSP1334-20130426/65541_1 /TAXON_ID=127549 /ORGANISM="Calcidiscus leptoporus, Strain RCC1130" /LENGTH=105 /DNA_ID=CAMNT_0007401709 /DNA_START=229 /DNA_END=546 /DNA_ORIENTATION=+